MGVFFKFKKGSQAARDHMAKIRAMRGKKRKKNPLTIKESASVAKEIRVHARTARAETRTDKLAGAYHRGQARSLLDMERFVKGKADKKRFRKAALKAFWPAGLAAATDKSPNARNYNPRKKNPPLLIIGNPGGKRRRPRVSQKARRVTGSRFGPPPAQFPAHIWRDPQFQRELKVFRSRHGAGVPIKVSKVNVPSGYPKYMTAYGTSQHAVYDAPKQSKRGRFIHSFGKKGKNKPFLVSSSTKGPKWLGYAGGTFNAKNKWLHW